VHEKQAKAEVMVFRGHTDDLNITRYRVNCSLSVLVHDASTYQPPATPHSRRGVRTP
jgi:hypothetical protein